MSQNMLLNQSPPSPEAEALIPPQTSAHTATAKLHEATTEYNLFVTLAESSQKRYNKHHQDLHRMYAAIHYWASKTPASIVQQNKLQYVTDCYADLTDDRACYLSDNMSRERKTWMELLQDAKAIKIQVRNKNLQLV